MSRDAVEAIIAARTAPGQIATLIVPADVAWSKGGTVASLPPLTRPPLPTMETIEHAAAMLRSGLRTAILTTGNALYGKGSLPPDALPRPRGQIVCSLSPHSFERGAGFHG